MFLIGFINKNYTIFNNTYLFQYLIKVYCLAIQAYFVALKYLYFHINKNYICTCLYLIEFRKNDLTDLCEKFAKSRLIYPGVKSHRLSAVSFIHRFKMTAICMTSITTGLKSRVYFIF